MLDIHASIVNFYSMSYSFHMLIEKFARMDFENWRFEQMLAPCLANGASPSCSLYLEKWRPSSLDNESVYNSFISTPSNLDNQFYMCSDTITPTPYKF